MSSPFRGNIALKAKVRTLLNAEIQSEITSDFLLSRTAILLLLYAAKRNPWLAQNIHATNFLCSIELICLICWLKIVMIIHVSFCFVLHAGSAEYGA